MLNTLVNTLAYRQKGGEPSYLYWGSWLAHNLDSLTSLQDADGPLIQGQFMASCPSLNLLEVALQPGTPSLTPILAMLNAPDWSNDHELLRRRELNTMAPSKARITAMIAFAASCVALLLFLWLSFGGSVPFVAAGLPDQRRVRPGGAARHAGGRRDRRRHGRQGGQRRARPPDRADAGGVADRSEVRAAAGDTRATLREKTLLGETYVELSFGNPRGRMLRDGAQLPQAQVAPTVQLDQILDTFDPQTRRAFQTWMQDDGIAFTNRGQDFNDALAELYPFATNVSNVLGVLQRDNTATSTLLSDGGQVLSAISQNPASCRA